MILKRTVFYFLTLVLLTIYAGKSFLVKEFSFYKGVDELIDRLRTL